MSSGRLALLWSLSWKLWVAVQLATCRARGILWRPHYRPHSMLTILAKMLLVVIMIILAESNTNAILLEKVLDTITDIDSFANTSWPYLLCSVAYLLNILTQYVDVDKLITDFCLWLLKKQFYCKNGQFLQYCSVLCQNFKQKAWTVLLFLWTSQHLKWLAVLDILMSTSPEPVLYVLLSFVCACAPIMAAVYFWAVKTKFTHEKVLFTRKLWPTPLPTNIVTPNLLYTSLPAPMYIYALCLFRMLFLSIISTAYHLLSGSRAARLLLNWLTDWFCCNLFWEIKTERLFYDITGFITVLSVFVRSS